MKATDLQRPPTDSAKDPFATYVVLSAVFHAMLLLGVVGGAWWWRTPTYYKPAPYSVSLVDAPVSLRQPAPAGGRKDPAREAETPRQQQTPPVPPPPEKKPDVAPPQAAPPPAPPKPEKPVVAAPASPKKPAPRPTRARAVKERPEPRQKPKRTDASSRKRPSTRTPAKTAKREVATAPAARKPTPPSGSRRSTRATSSAAAEQANQRVAEQRLDALRERFGRGALGATTSSETAEGLEEVRLRAYQELVREQIIEAWILPMPEQEAHSLQATALLTVERDGRVTGVKLLEPSGHALFDDSLLRAIAQAAPLPALPDDYRGGILELELRFRAGGV